MTNEGAPSARYCNCLFLYSHTKIPHRLRWGYLVGEERGLIPRLSRWGFGVEIYSSALPSQQQLRIHTNRPVLICLLSHKHINKYFSMGHPNIYEDFLLEE